MPFYQNPFTFDFEGNWLLGDRQHIPKFVVPGNKGRGDEVVAVHAEGPYNLSGNDADSNAKNVLNIEYAIHDFKNWVSLAVTITASSLSAVTPAEIAASLNDNATFADLFEARTVQKFASGSARLEIKQRHPVTKMRFYILNGQAETVLSFNKFAGVAEIPSYFARHTIANRFTYTDSVNQLIALDVSGSDVDAAVVDNAVNYRGESLNLDSSTVNADYVLLKGKSGLFIFSKQTESSGNITSKIEYHAGAVAGDLAKKTTYANYSNNVPGTITEVPYVLTSSDLVTP